MACNYGLLWIYYSLLWGIVAYYFGLLGVPGIVYSIYSLVFSKYLESQWPVIIGYFGSRMGYFGVQWPVVLGYWASQVLCLLWGIGTCCFGLLGFPGCPFRPASRKTDKSNVPWIQRPQTAPAVLSQRTSRRPD